MVKDGNGQTCLTWPGHQSMDQSRQHDFQLQHPHPGSTSSDEIRKRSFGWCGIDLLGWYAVRSNGRLQLPWGHLRHGCDFIFMGFYILIYFDMSKSHALQSITVLNTVYVYKYFIRINKNQCRRLLLPSPISTVTVTPPFSRFPGPPPGITAQAVTVRA